VECAFIIGASFTVKRVPTASLTPDHFKASVPSAHDERCFDVDR
jgi:hypothetical protein